MGMFDTVIFRCPKCNGATIFEQSKAGECLLIDYNSNEVPTEIALDILGNKVWCEKCNETFEIVSATKPERTIKLWLE